MGRGAAVRRGGFGLGGGSVGPEYVGAGAITADFTAVARPAVIAGDTLIGLFGYTGAGAANAPTGWTLVRSDASGTRTLHVLVKTATGSEPATYALGTSGTGVLRIFAYRGLAASPVDTSAGSGALGSINYIRFPSVTVASQRLLVGLGYVNHGSWGTGTIPPAGMTERIDSSFDGNLLYAADQYPVTGTTGTKDATGGGTNTDTVGISLALIPA